MDAFTVKLTKAQVKAIETLKVNPDAKIHCTIKQNLVINGYARFTNSESPWVNGYKIELV